VERSIAEGRDAPGSSDLAVGRARPVAIGLGIAVLALVLYVLGNGERLNFYNHFVWQADAFLHGRVSIPYPVPEGASDEPFNDYFQDVLPVDGTLVGPDGVATGAALVPFPPLPALVLLPLVAVQGLAADQGLLLAGLAAVGVGLAWWVLGRLPITLEVRALVTVFFALGTVWWWTAVVGSTWYFAHVVATDLGLLAVGVALGADPLATDPDVADDVDKGSHARRTLLSAVLPLDHRQVVAGLLLGLAATARLPMALGVVFLFLVGGGWTWQRRTVSAAAGAAIPIAMLLAYNVATTGSIFHPGYEYQYQHEAFGYTSLGYHLDWSIEDVRYIPQNLGIMFASLPALLPTVLPNTLGPRFIPDIVACTDPGAVRRLFDPDCPLAIPRDIGTSILLVSPAFLLIVPAALRGWGRSRLVTGGLAAILLIAVLNLAHFSQGWVQWGYRFSNDFVPFALPLVAVGATASRRLTTTTAALVLVSVLVNAWGVAWGNVLGW